MDLAGAIVLVKNYAMLVRGRVSMSWAEIRRFIVKIGDRV